MSYIYVDHCPLRDVHLGIIPLHEGYLCWALSLAETHCGRAVEDMNCLPSLESWDRGFEPHSRHGCLCVRLFCVCVVLCVGSGLATG
jgi:hypothetical protein